MISIQVKVFKGNFSEYYLTNDFLRLMPLIAHINGYKVTEISLIIKKENTENQNMEP